MGLTDVLVQCSDVVSVSMEVFVGSGVLQHAGNGAQDVALFWLQGGAGRPLHHVEAVWSHDGWVHVAIVDQVTDDLQGRRGDVTLTRIFNVFPVTSDDIRLKVQVSFIHYCDSPLPPAE